MRTIPAVGLSREDVLASLEAAKKNDFDWTGGGLPVYVYYRDEELRQVTEDAYLTYMMENALGAKNAFPSVGDLERQIVEMGLSLFNATPAGGGTFCSGGTESIFMALKTCRDKARAERPEVTRPKIVIPYTAHPTVNKGADFLGLEVVRVPVGSDLRADVAAMERAIDSQTIGLLGSAPCYPYGVFDPIEDLGKLARKHGLWLHVDACVGGFLAPFARDIGYPIPPFDLSVEGVSSLSADLHKYGYAAKGASLVMFSDAADQKYQKFECAEWPRGLYWTYTFQGTRPGGAVAAAWAVLNYLGVEGYRENARIIMDTKARLMAGIEAVPGLRVLRPTDLCILLYYSEDPALDLNAVADQMRQRGWFVGVCLEPLAIAMALNTAQAASVDRYVADLAESARIVREEGLKAKVAEGTY